MIKPHGGKIIRRKLAGAAKKEALARSGELFRLRLNKDLLSDVENISSGVFSPLEGFLGEEELACVVDGMRLPSGVAWTIPIVLDVSAAEAKNVREGGEILLESPDGRPVALMRVTQKYSFDKAAMAKKVFGTADEKHPGVGKVLKLQDIFLGGSVELIDGTESPYGKYAFSPDETREQFEKMGWETVVGFQTRNIPHVGHEYVQKAALTFVDGLFINPVIGRKKKGDFRDDVILSTYQALMDLYYPKGNVMMGILQMEMRYAGPKEAIHHAIIRKNFGCTHFIVGRDHAGVGNYYSPYAAHDIFREFPELEIKPLFFKSFYYCKKCGAVVNEKICPHKEKADIIDFSGTGIREMFMNGLSPEKEVIRPEVWDIIRKHGNPFVDLQNSR